MDNVNKSTAENRDDGTYVVKKNKKSSIFAFIVCILIAFVIWAYAEATDKQDKADDLPSEPAVACAEFDGESSFI